MNNQPNFQPEPFTPSWGLGNAHTQTITANLFRSKKGVTLRRARLETPDDDFIDIDFADVHGATWEDLGDDAPVVLLLHGLEGNSERGYMLEEYRQLAERGIRPVGINYRSCSGEMNRGKRTYHAGASDDVAFVHDVLLKLYPSVPHGLIGFSLGTAMLLKYLGENNGERSQHPNIQAAVAISPFFNMNSNSGTFEEGSGKFYSQRLLNELLGKLRLRADQLRDLIDVERALKSETVRDFDEYVTAPLHGFKSATDYYDRCSPINFLPDVAVPTLLIRALDDPFFTDADVPYDIIDANPHLQASFTEHGGHVGFLEGFSGGYWAERQAARFLAEQLGSASAGQQALE